MGHDVVSDYQQARRVLGVVPQELSFDPFFTVRETLRGNRAILVSKTMMRGLTSCSKTSV